MKQPALLYHGKAPPVHLAENGFNSEGYSEKAMEDQAAGMALAWKKMAELSSIESWDEAIYSKRGPKRRSWAFDMADS